MLFFSLFTFLVKEMPYSLSGSVFVPNTATIIVVILSLVALSLNTYLLSVVRRDAKRALDSEVDAVDANATYAVTLLTFVLLFSFGAFGAHLVSKDSSFLSLWHAIAGFLCILAGLLLVNALVAQSSLRDASVFRILIGELLVVAALAFFLFFLAVLHRSLRTVEA
jgi:hypothetical protein